jgi:peptide-methionine (R)-S-oxide reductase
MLNRRSLLGSLFAVGGFAAVARPIRSWAQTVAKVTLIKFSDGGANQGPVVVDKIVKTDAEWRALLPADSYEVARHAGTERAFSGKYDHLFDKGLYRCICCETALYSSDTKFDSGTGWPSFWAPIAKQNVVEKTDRTLGMERTEILCPRCDAHLGHVFDDGPRPTGLRYCMNSVALKFIHA